VKSKEFQSGEIKDAKFEDIAPQQTKAQGTQKPDA
jgi:hypothetical protein